MNDARFAGVSHLPNDVHVNPSFNGLVVAYVMRSAIGASGCVNLFGALLLSDSMHHD